MCEMRPSQPTEESWVGRPAPCHGDSSDESSFHSVANRRDGCTMVPLLRPTRKFRFSTKEKNKCNASSCQSLLRGGVCLLSRSCCCRLSPGPVRRYFCTILPAAPP